MTSFDGAFPPWEMASSAEDASDVYDLPETDGSWWVVGWDPELGTFFAQHVARTPTGVEVVREDFGRLAGEVPTTERLSELIGRVLPGRLTECLLDDAAAVPARDVVPGLPWDLRHAAELRRGGAVIDEPGWSTAMARIAQLYRDKVVVADPSGHPAVVLERPDMTCLADRPLESFDIRRKGAARRSPQCAF